MSRAATNTTARKWVVAALWSAYIALPFITGATYSPDEFCYASGAALRFFLTSVGYWAIGVALYLMTARPDDDAEGRRQRAGAAFATMTIMTALMTLAWAYDCP